jgi:hypothetical protein
MNFVFCGAESPVAERERSATSALPNKPIAPDVRGAHSLHRLVGPFNFVGLHVRKMRLAGHRSRSFAVKMSRRIANSPASVCHAMPGYGITDPPMAAVTASGCPMGRRATNRDYARFFPTQTLGPASLSIRHGRLHAVSSGAAQHGKSKVWSYDGLSVDGLLTKGLVPQIWNDAFMRPNK